MSIQLTYYGEHNVEATVQQISEEVWNKLKPVLTDIRDLGYFDVGEIVLSKNVKISFYYDHPLIPKCEKCGQELSKTTI